MNFLNPFVLFGLIAASIPIILHLLNLRKLRTVEFSSIKFLKELQESQIRKLKIRQILLLVLRTLLIIFIVLAFSRPVIKGTLPGMTNYAQTSAVILIDNSPSMNYSDEFGNRFNYAKRTARKLIEQFRSGDEVAVIPMSDLKDFANYNFSRDLQNLKEQINKINISYSVADFDKSISLSSALFENSRNINKEIFIISDNQLINFKSIDTISEQSQNNSILKKYHPSIYFLEVGAKSKIDYTNLSIDSVQLLTQIFQQNKPVQILANIHNYSKEDQPSTILSIIYNNERVAQLDFSINANSTKSVNISANPKDYKIVSAEAKLESDALEEDNSKYFGFIMPHSPKIAVVDDEKNPYLLSALGISNTNNLYSSEVMTVNDFNNKTITDYDAIIINSLKNLNVEKLRQYIANGGKAILFADDNLAQSPNYLALLGIQGGRFTQYPEGQMPVVSQIQKLSPIFEGVFTDKSSFSLNEKIHFKKLYSISSGFPIIQTTSGDLAFEKNLDKGKFIFIASHPSLDWGSFPISSLFPVFINRSVEYLTMISEISRSATIGQSLQITIPENYAKGSSFKIIDPLKNESVLYAPNLSEGTTLKFDNLSIPGNYIIYNQADEPVAMVSANIDKRESDISQIQNSAIESLLKKKYSDKINISFIEDLTSIDKSIQRIRTGSELWQLFVILALLCGIAELIVERVSKNEVVAE